MTYGDKYKKIKLKLKHKYARSSRFVRSSNFVCNYGIIRLTVMLSAIFYQKVCAFAKRTKRTTKLTVNSLQIFNYRPFLDRFLLPV